MSAKRVLVLAAAVATVWALLAAAAWGAGPLFLVGPPITRRVSGFHEFTGGGCTLVLAQGVWTDSFETVSCTNETRADFATCSDTPQRHWRFAGEAQRCGARRMSAADARRLLAGQRLVFAGDSIARNLYGATLRLLGQPGQDIVVGHANFQHELEGGISLHFFWAPYPQNLTAVLGQLATEAAGARAAARGQGEEGEPQEQEQQRDEAGAGGEAGAEVAGEAAGEAGEQREASATDPAAEAQMPAGAEGEPEQRKAQEEQGAAGMPGGSEAADGPVEQQAGQPQEEEQQLQGGEEGVTRRQGRRSLRAAASDSTSAVQAEAGQQEAEEREQQQQQRPPSLAVLSTTLWHLLHFTEASDFEAQLGQLRAAAEGLGPAAGARQGDTAGGGAAPPPRLVLASGTETFPNRMKTAEKQRNMTPANLDAYNKAMEQSGLLAPAGPFSLLDLFPLTRSCGEECSTDGVHSLPVVYDAALQLLLNIAAADPQAAPQQPARRALRQRLPG